MAKLTSEDIQLLILDEVKGGNSALIKLLSEALKQSPSYQTDPEIKQFIGQLNDKIANFVSNVSKPIPTPQITVNTDTKQIERMFAEIRSNQSGLKAEAEKLNDNLLSVVSLLSEKPQKMKVTKRNNYSDLIEEIEIVYTSGNTKKIS